MYRTEDTGDTPVSLLVLMGSGRAADCMHAIESTMKTTSRSFTFRSLVVYDVIPCSKAFSPSVNFQCSFGPPCAFACTNICVHVKNP